jgi:hypothetical protein
MHIGQYIDLIHRTQSDLIKAFELVANAHRDEVDVFQTCMLLSSWSKAMASDLEPIASRYRKENDDQPDWLSHTLLKKTRKGGAALLRDLHDLYLIVTEVLLCCTLSKQGGMALGDEAFVTICEETERQSKRQLSWLMTKMKSAAPQTLIVAQ